MARGELRLILDKLPLTRYFYATGMKSGSHQDSAQAMQRVRVGMTGLLIVLVLIGLASAIFSSANRDVPVAAIGAPNASVVANMIDGSQNSTTEKGKDEPLAEMGVTPSTGATEAVDAAKIARQQQAARQGQH
ncbi:hypothetical protein [Sphingomonas sp.]|uniref:hypothetical protein n=1 Tax=Sphingomonas sp. TaxID=28214 RepID=UPI0025EC3F10|nr:hypothetical protein [Sphingomonas sp.]